MAARLYVQTNNVLPNVKVLAPDYRTSNIALEDDPVVIGNLPAVAVNNADANGKTRAQKDGIWNLTVAGIDDGGTSGADRNVAVNGGDKIYFDHTKNPALSKRTGGVFFGYAFGDHATQLVASGNTTTKIPVQVGA